MNDWKYCHAKCISRYASCEIAATHGSVQLPVLSWLSNEEKAHMQMICLMVIIKR